MCSILIFEDNTAFLRDLMELFKSVPGYSVAAAYNNAENAHKHVEECWPDVIIMDLEMPAVDGLAGVQSIRAAGIKLPIIILTSFDDSNHVFEAICAGASGYLLKSAEPEKIIAGIEEVLHGGAPMSPAIAAKAIKLLANQNRKGGDEYNLTEKEAETLKLLVDGNSYKMIAAALNVGRETVKTHIRNIYEKLQVHSSTEAVGKALRERIVQPSK